MRLCTRSAVVLVALGLMGGCNGIVLSPVHQGTGASATGSTGTGATGTGGSAPFVERLTDNVPNKIDLLLMVDNHSTMATKQQLLASAVPELIAGIVNPPCLDSTTQQPVAMQPAGPLDVCPVGSTRAFAPVLDVHIGVLSSSLGTFGADGCPDTPPSACPNADTTPTNDHGHLVTRSSSCDTAGPVPTYQNEGFLAWDPRGQDNPAGEATLGAIGSGGLIGTLSDIVVGDGNEGCGFESQNEAWYRFLVDPAPYQSIRLVNNSVQTTGVDTTLLQQRKEFLRPDSLLVIVVVTDKPDGSLKEFSSYPLFAAPEVHLPLPRTECSTKGPNDPCCASCGQVTPPGCPADPVCTPPNNYYTNANEDTSLRAFGLISHKARYGIEFYYQPSRYVAALTSATVTDATNQQVANPIFSNLDPANYDGAVRDATQVLYATIAGVPWQLIARQNAAGKPDLVGGVSALDTTQVGGFKTAAELSLKDAQGYTFWDDIAGDPESYVPARSPYMQESTVPRSGADPITGLAIQPVTAAAGASPINGHERTIASPPNSIEYACIYPLATPIDEGASSGVTIGRCVGAPTDDPACSPNANDEGRNTLQTSDVAWPGVKHLAIARGLGDQGIVGSVCAAQISDPTSIDYGYRPSIRAIIHRIQRAEQAGCLPRALTPAAAGTVDCTIVEGLKVAAPSACDCGATARSPVTAAQQSILAAIQQDPVSIANGLNCFCDIDQANGAALTDCETNPASSANGWCYVAASEGAAQARLVASCPATEQQQLRFVGKGEPATGSTIFIACGQ